MPSSHLKNYEINTGIQSFVVEYKQFSFIEIPFAYDKSVQHNTFYDSYNTEIAATNIVFLKKNANDNESISNKINFYLKNENDKLLMYRQFVAWYTKGSGVAPLTEYANNEVYQELQQLKNIYDKTKKDELLYIDLRRRHGYTGEFEKSNRNDSNLSLT